MNRITIAFDIIHRQDFLPDDMKDAADLDIALPIGYGQTNSQPSTVAQMLSWLSPRPGDKILDVGCGSGWTTALLSFIVGSAGRVYATELIPELLAFSKANCMQSGVHNAVFSLTQHVLGWPEHAPYDGILVSAAADSIPSALLDQLQNGGKMVIPVKESIFVVKKVGSETYETFEHPGYIFVPLVDTR